MISELRAKFVDFGLEPGFRGPHPRRAFARCLHASLKIVELLLERGADVNLGDGRRKTPLHQALQAPCNSRSENAGQQAAIVQLLLDHGAACDDQVSGVA